MHRQLPFSADGSVLDTAAGFANEHSADDIADEVQRRLTAAGITPCRHCGSDTCDPNRICSICEVRVLRQVRERAIRMALLADPVTAARLQRLERIKSAISWIAGVQFALLILTANDGTSTAAIELQIVLLLIMLFFGYAIGRRLNRLKGDQ